MAFDLINITQDPNFYDREKFIPINEFKSAGNPSYKALTGLVKDAWESVYHPNMLSAIKSSAHVVYIHHRKQMATTFLKMALYEDIMRLKVPQGGKFIFLTVTGKEGRNVSKTAGRFLEIAEGQHPIQNPYPKDQAQPEILVMSCVDCNAILKEIDRTSPEKPIFLYMDDASFIPFSLYHQLFYRHVPNLVAIRAAVLKSMFSPQNFSIPKQISVISSIEEDRQRPFFEFEIQDPNGNSVMMIPFKKRETSGI